MRTQKRAAALVLTLLLILSAALPVSASGKDEDAEQEIAAECPEAGEIVSEDAAEGPEEGPDDPAGPAEAAEELPAGEDDLSAEPAADPDTAEGAAETEEDLPESDPVTSGSGEADEAAAVETEKENEEADIPEELPAELPWTEPGNRDEEITAGGRYLLTDDCLYYSDGGIWCDRNGSTSFITTDEGMNLNLSDGWLYYTLSGEVRRVSAAGGAEETVYSFGPVIDQMYVMGSELRFLSGGDVYSYRMSEDVLLTCEAPEDVKKLIPTPWGNVCLTGEPFSYTVWAAGEPLCSGVGQCRRDGDWLILDMGGETWQVYLPDAFDGVFAPEPYSLHGEMLAVNGLSDVQQLENEAAFLQSSEYAAMQDGLSMHTDGAYTATNDRIAYTAYSSSSLTTDQKNIVLRGRQMAEVKWTPVKKRYSWGGDDSSYVDNNASWGSKVTATDGTVTYGYFAAGKTYEGIPYSQAVYTGFVGWSVSISTFVQAVNDSSSKFYSGYSDYSRTAPYYGTDCSAFVSWAWDLSTRCTCTSMLKYSTYIGKSLSSLRIGDCLNNPNSHVVLVTNIGYDADGNVNAVEITEETPCKVRVTCYGELLPGKTYQNTGTLSYIERYYFNGGYAIYRRNASGSVSFTESDAVSLVETGYASAPTISVKVNEAGSAKLVTLSHSVKNARIYYTTDGTKPSSSSTLYTGTLTVTSNTTIRAIAVLGSPYTGSYELRYTVSAERAEKPVIRLVSGNMQGSYVSSGSKVCASNSAGDKIYYTTDGSEPTKKSAVMPASGIKVTKDIELKVIAVNDSALNSKVATASLLIGTFYTIGASASEGGSVTPEGNTGVLEGSSQTFRFTAQDHFAIEDVLVDGKSVGKVSTYTFRNVKEKHTISVRFEVHLPFTDVASGWYVESVTFAYAHDLFSGTSATRFSPNQYMTRGMFITVLGRFAGGGQWTDLESWSGCLGITSGGNINIRQQTNTSDTSVIVGNTGESGLRVKVLSVVPKGLDGARWYRVNTGSVTGYIRATTNNSSARKLLYVYEGSFSDLPAGAYYTGYAQWASAYGLVNGVSSTSFAPNQYIRRQDICVILYSYLTSYLGKTVSSRAATFTDDASISSYARTAVYAMKNIGVVNGYTDGSFHPTGYATRAEVAAMFESLYHYLND